MVWVIIDIDIGSRCRTRYLLFDLLDLGLFKLHSGGRIRGSNLEEKNRKKTAKENSTVALQRSLNCGSMGSGPLYIYWIISCSTLPAPVISPP